MLSTAALNWLTSGKRPARLWRAQPTPAEPAEVGDALAAADMIAAGVPVADAAAALAARLPRAADWTADVAIAAAVAANQPRPQAQGQAAGPRQLSNVVCLRRFSGPPHTFEFQVDGSAPFVVDADTLNGATKFAAACLGACGSLPSLPMRYDQWVAFINPILDAAELVQESPDTTDDGHEREVVAGQLALLTAGDAPEDMAAGKWLPHEGRRAVSLAPLLHTIKARLPTMTPRRLARRLRELDWTAAKIGATHTWLSPDEVAPPESVAAALDRVRGARLSLVPSQYADDDRPFFDREEA